MQMDRAIFELNASVEATSLYILLCALLDQGEPPTMERAKKQWNGSEETLVAAAEELSRRGVIDACPPFKPGQHLHVTPRNQWC